MVLRSILFSVSIVTLSISALEFEFFEANTCAISETDLIKAYTSYHECLNHCKTRMDCAAVSYLQKATMCRLNVGLPIPGPCKGYAYSSKVNNWEKDSSEECKCPIEKQCKQNGDCVPSECRKLGDPGHGKLLGTQFSIGDKITFMCYPGYVLQTSGKRVCTSNGTWSGQDAICVEDKDCSWYLVSGPNGVEDSQLSQSSYWCQDIDCMYYHDAASHDGSSARFSRLDSLGFTSGSWSARYNTKNEYIQVDFRTPRTISGIVLQGRDSAQLEFGQYVTEFKVLYSLDCVEFRVITDEDGDHKRFQGNSSPDDTVTRYLPERVRARCVRLNPTAWERHISLRFDVLGC